MSDGATDGAASEAEERAYTQFVRDLNAYLGGPEEARTAKRPGLIRAFIHARRMRRGEEDPAEAARHFETHRLPRLESNFRDTWGELLDEVMSRVNSHAFGSLQALSPFKGCFLVRAIVFSDGVFGLRGVDGDLGGLVRAIERSLGRSLPPPCTEFLVGLPNWVGEVTIVHKPPPF